MSVPEGSTLAARIDHAVLAPSATEADVLRAASMCARLGVRGLCVTPRRIRVAAAAVAGSGVIPIAVLAFPAAAGGRAASIAEASGARRDGAAEIDLVLPWGEILEGRWGGLLDEITDVVGSAGLPWKGIVEASELPDDVIRAIVRELLVPAGAAFLKTGTGVHGRPLPEGRISGLKALLPASMRLKVSGGIRDREAAETALRAGADVLGTSRTADILGATGAT